MRNLKGDEAGMSLEGELLSTLVTIGARPEELWLGDTFCGVVWGVVWGAIFPSALSLYSYIRDQNQY